MAGNIDNLKPWKPGQSGNPAGRPKGTGRKTFDTLLKLFQSDDIEMPHPTLDRMCTPDEMAIIHLVTAVANGEPWAVRDYLDRRAGKPAQSIEVEQKATAPSINFPDDDIIDIDPEATESPADAERPSNDQGDV